MVQFKKMLALFLAGITFYMYFPYVTIAQEASKNSESDIKPHSIEIRSTPDEVLKVVEGKKRKWWLWSLVGVAIIGGTVALLSPGGEDSSESSTGSATVSW